MARFKLPPVANADDNVRYALERIELFLNEAIGDIEGALGGHKIAGGSSSVTFSGAVTSANTTVTHGLGATPVAVQATNAGNSAVNCSVTNVGATTFDVFGRTTNDVVRTASDDFYWIAIG